LRNADANAHSESKCDSDCDRNPISYTYSYAHLRGGLVGWAEPAYRFGQGGWRLVSGRRQLLHCGRPYRRYSGF